MTKLGTSLLVTASIVASSPLASAQLGRHHHRIYGASGDRHGPLVHGSSAPVYGWDAPGAIVRAAAARAQTEPGVTSELAPDAVQTATGGPVGGVPGFSGGR